MSQVYSRQKLRAKLWDILLVEDNQADVFLVRSALEQAGLDFTLRLCTHGEAVLCFLDEVEPESPGTTPPDLILLDLNLPRYTGNELLDRMRDTRCRTTPVVVITSSDSPADHRAASAHDVAHYLRKPADFDEFMNLGAVAKRILCHLAPTEE